MSGVKKQAVTNNSNIVELLKKKREEQAQEFKKYGHTRVFTLLDKRRTKSNVTDIIYPEVSLYIPIDESIDDIDGEKVSGSVTMRYIKGERSLFKHKQTEGITIKEPITFNSGAIVVNERNDMALVLFLTYHPKNQESPFKQSGINPSWYLENSEKILQEQIERDDAISKVQEDIIKLSDEELTKVALAHGLESYDNPKQTKMILKSIAESDPSKANKMLNDPLLEIKSTYRLALILGILKNNNKKLMWGDTDGQIVLIPKGKDPHQYAAEFFTREDGVVVIEKINEIISQS